MRRRAAFVSHLELGVLMVGVSMSAVYAGGGPLLVPLTQTRSIAGTAYAEDAFGGPVDDSDSDQAPDFGPFNGAAAADAIVDSAIGSGGGQQTSSILSDGITAEGSMFANAETWDFDAVAEASSLNRMQVTFRVESETSYSLQGQISAFDEALAEVSLRDSSREIFGVVIFGPATTLPVDERGALLPGEYTLELRLEGSVFGSDFFPAYSSAEYDVTFLLGATAPGGEVPDGDDVPGVPLRVDRVEGGAVRLNWSPSCRPADTDFGVYEGRLGDPESLASVRCSTAGATQWELFPAFDGSFFVVVPHDGASEGSYGDTGTGTERLPSFAACHTQALAAPVCP